MHPTTADLLFRLRQHATLESNNEPQAARYWDLRVNHVVGNWLNAGRPDFDEVCKAGFGWIDEGSSTAGPLLSPHRFVAVHPEMGIYLGSCMGLGFWSKLDAVGQDCAVTFESADECMRYFDEMYLIDLHVRKTLAARPVTITTHHGFASIDDCVRAGLEAWSPDD